MDKFLDWYNRNYTEISWFLIGWLTMGFLDQLGRGHYVTAVIDGGLAYLNYEIWKRRL